MRISDWSSDVCSSDLQEALQVPHHVVGGETATVVPGYIPAQIELPAPQVRRHRPVRQQVRARDVVVSGARQRLADLVDDVRRLQPRHGMGIVELMHAGAKGQAPSPADRSEEHTSELKSLMRISYAVFCLKKKHT